MELRKQNQHRPIYLSSNGYYFEKKIRPLEQKRRFWSFKKGSSSSVYWKINSFSEALREKVRGKLGNINDTRIDKPIRSFRFLRNGCKKCSSTTKQRLDSGVFASFILIIFWFLLLGFLLITDWHVYLYRNLKLFNRGFVNLIWDSSFSLRGSLITILILGIKKIVFFVALLIFMSF